MTKRFRSSWWPIFAAHGMHPRPGRRRSCAPPPRSLVEAAHQRRPLVTALRNDPAYDLAVVGTHGRTGLKHVLLGSVAEKVVRHAPCAVLVVRERD